MGAGAAWAFLRADPNRSERKPPSGNADPTLQKGFLEMYLFHRRVL